MAGTITIVASKKVDNPAGGYTAPLEGNGQRKYKQTGTGGSAPGAVDISFDETDISFGSLDSPAWVRLENLSSEFAVKWGPKSGGSMVPAGRLRKRVVDSNGNVTYHGGVALFELEPGVTLTMQALDEDGPSVGSESSSSGGEVRVQISAEEL